ncbi:putative bifunctional diguanylate cyclase/phosphodiesterase [Billgrantia kenyensis]|uniref:Bifunctional diguanylate cyclase/phosphodiesterase n=1 Tax=Billgrantia kenyensis TaxID=321266 RepID=A0A7V9W3R4_9GAMM|nr:bifunctional diguanylate cyclase/phosphodiesterase [Halomonas kenyensis]MBA2780434.1 bifunctional diguanylate cyclase/phosphodiesterase [Halomonas kenyensis]MCG6663358.1 bifunctional diguanylate cyclase/phosphodiesterase [Halomonas kenyensis]
MRQFAYQSRQPRPGRRQPTLDAVTGLTTRRDAEQHLAVLLAEADERDSRVAILHIDIDRLKEVNHAFGRAAGDDCLRQLAQRFSATVGSRGSVSRLDSDEVMVVLPDVTDVAEVIPTVEQLLRKSHEPLELSGQALLSSCCIGLALFPDHGATVIELMRQANLARRKAQARGSGQYCVFSPDLLEDCPDRIQLRGEVREALQRGEMALCYRPVLCARSGQVVAISAQPRWHSPSFGLLGPQQWVAAAHEAGRLYEISHWVLAYACRHARSWYEAGSGLKVVVGLPMEGMSGDRLVESVGQALEHSGLPSGLLALEMTENDLMQAPESAVVLLDRLKAMGVQLVVDGFGSGHSMLGHLAMLPIDTLKLDAQFVKNCLDSPRHQAVIRSIIGMAHELGMKVAAGGVSHRQQADFLREQGCDLLQGGLWSRMEYSDELSHE